MALTAAITVTKQPVKGPDLPLGRGEKVITQSDPSNAGVVLFSDNPDPLENGFALSPGDQVTLSMNPSGLNFAASSKQIVRFLVSAA